jgi:hypothetical protein
MARSRIGVITLLLAALGLLPPVAQASDTARLDVSFSPYKLGRTTTIDLRVAIANSDGGLPSPVISFDARMPPHLELVASTLGLAICQPAALQAAGSNGCSPNARIGTGSAHVEVPFGPELVDETASIQAFMGPPVGENIGVLLFGEALSPVFAQAVFPGVLILGSGPLGESLNTTVPLVPSLPGAPDVSITSMRLSMGPDHLTYYKKVHGKTVSFHPEGISLPPVCPRGGFLFVSSLAFQDGTSLEVSRRVPCPAGATRRKRSSGLSLSP